ncbi:MAG: polymorphic outer membrane protein [Parcubacteria group bacterium Gr01-1014_13]|nr:MAG: polymorphic outer membrane protein [Parcubacteria group bacterium Gr01-1014_13]
MGTNKKIIILLVVLALGGAGVLAYKKFISSKQVDKNLAPSSSSSLDEARQQEFDDAIKKTSASDQDMDGIPDNEEAKYKTSVTSSDTDEDGLPDHQEIFNFKTDPLKADTDDDGSADGYEVRRGSDPKKI